MKIVKLAVVALATFSLLSSCKEKEPQDSHKDLYLTLKFSDIELKAIESKIEGNSEGLITKDVVLKINEGALGTIHLSSAQIEEAKGSDGTKIRIKKAVTSVSMTANGVIDNNTEIKSLQKKGAEFLKSIPLVAETKNIVVTQEGTSKVYTATLAPTPNVARIEVFGKIQPKPNAKGKNAYKSVEVEAVYMNNYLTKPNSDRYYTPTNGKDNFASSPALISEMYDNIDSSNKADFEGKKKAVAYQIFPCKKGEVASSNGYFDHIILKVKVTHSDEAVAAGVHTVETGFLTIQHFMVKNGSTINGFEAGKIYKLDLENLSGDFKTGGGNGPDPDPIVPDDPVTPDPEPNGKHILKVVVKPYKWTAVDIVPALGDGYK